MDVSLLYEASRFYYRLKLILVYGFVSVAKSWVATCPVKIGVKVIAMIQEQIKLAMPILQWNLSAAIEK